MVSEDRSIIQIVVILRRRFDNLQDLCMKYNRNIKHNETIKYLGERVGVCECVRAVSYTHLDVYKRQPLTDLHPNQQVLTTLQIRAVCRKLFDSV